MRKINLPLVLDTLFAALCAFLLFFTSLRYYTKNAVIALIFAVAAFVLFGLLSYFYISKKQNKKLLISKDERHKTLLALHLSLSSDEYIEKLFTKGLSADGEKCEICDSRINVGNNCYFFIFKMQPISEDDAAKVIKVKCDKNKIIVCNRPSPEAQTLCENFSIEIKDITFVYELLKEKQLLPEKYVYDGAKKVTFLNKIKLRFSRKICAPLFWSGLGLLALSYFTFFPIYYILSGGIMLILSAVALIFN